MSYKIDRWHKIHVYDIEDDKHILEYGTVAIPRVGEGMVWDNDKGYTLSTTVVEVHYLIGKSGTIFDEIRIMVEVNSVLS